MSQISPKKMQRTLATVGLTIGAVGLGLLVNAVTAPVANAISWGNLIKILAPDRRSGTSRSATPCAVMMEDQKINLTASHQPTLVWTKRATKVQLRVFGEEKPFWQTEQIKSVGNLRLVSYQGEPLQAGVTYEWMIDGTFGDTQVRFQVSPEKQQELEKRLQRLSGKDEDTLNERMKIYGEAGLGNDGLKELLDYASPSKGLKQQIQELGKNWCSPSKVVPPLDSRR